IDASDDEFAFPQAYLITKHPINDEKAHLVANWVTDVPYAYGVQFSGLITLGTGPRLDVAGRFNPAMYEPGGFTPDHFAFLIPAKIWAFREVDLRLRKTFPSVSGTTPDTAAFLDTLQHRTFNFFWDLTPPGNGLTPDRWPTPSFSSIAAVGFALTAYPIGAEHGWITRAQAADRTLKTLQFFWTAP